jgi:hypothetical protein
LFSFISINWRGRPLRTYETIVNLIANTTNRGGLVVRARLDRRRYPTGRKVTPKQLRALSAGFAHRDHPFRAIVTGRSGPS